MLPPCLILLDRVATQAKSLDELIERIKEAIELCLEVKQENAEALEFISVQRVSVQK
ncbi:type II toxin-antitoxin system HicB family antitoxin [uncultured Nostoc sp.]|uniref:type II toxin-antitoxin system HicB family antitoxin n=1 Tax=uncultured Nostoc sp. TaxID=340711 RepID=UPI00262DFE3D|nr:type II toxin-antitoxin system HicB family antitoxin [uncultured Nostoc sp.]